MQHSKQDQKQREVIERAIRFIQSGSHTMIARDTMADELRELLTDDTPKVVAWMRNDTAVPDFTTNPEHVALKPEAWDALTRCEHSADAIFGTHPQRAALKARAEQYAATLIAAGHLLEGAGYGPEVSVLDGIRDLIAKKALHSDQATQDDAKQMLLSNAEHQAILACINDYSNEPKVEPNTRILAGLRSILDKAEGVSIPDTHPSMCDGKEQYAFEAFAKREGYDLTAKHPMFYLFLDERTAAARAGWREAIEYCAQARTCCTPNIDQQPKLKVWYGSMPESNGKSNWTAILHAGDITQGITLARSEYPDRVRYEADRARFLIGELKDRPFLLDYDADKCDTTPVVSDNKQLAESVTPTTVTGAHQLRPTLDAISNLAKGFMLGSNYDMFMSELRKLYNGDRNA